MDKHPAATHTRLWKEHWQDEGDAAYLYRRIATAETDSARAKIFAELAAVEDRHIGRWEEVLRLEAPGHTAAGRRRSRDQGLPAGSAFIR